MEKIAATAHPIGMLTAEQVPTYDAISTASRVNKDGSI